MNATVTENKSCISLQIYGSFSLLEQMETFDNYAHIRTTTGNIKTY